MDCLSSGVQDQPGQHGETLSLPKILNTKTISWGWWLAPVVPAIQEDHLRSQDGEAAVSRDRATALQTG